MIARLVVLAVLALALPAHAAVTLSQFPPNPGVLPGGGWQFTPGTTFADPTPARAWTNGVYGSAPAAVVTDTFALKGPAGALAVSVSTAASVASIAAALARTAARAYGPLSVGMAAYELLNSSGIRQGASGAEMDVGVDKSPQQLWTTGCPYGKYVNGNFVAFSGIASTGPSAILKCHNARSNGIDFISLGCDSSTEYLDPYGNQFSVRCRYRTGVSPNGYETSQVYSANKSSQLGCSPLIDALTGQSYTPGIYSDGKCITGRYSAEPAAAIISRLSPSVQGDPAAAAKAAVEAGASIDAAPYTATGPASQTGTPSTTTTTGPAGVTSTTTTPTYNYTYGGSTVNISTTNTTTTNITNNAGDTSTTTTSKTEAGNDDKGMCALYPDSLACLKPGTPPAAEEIPIQRKQFSILPDTSRWAPTSGSCTRGAITLSTGVSINVWQPFCDFFGLIRGVVVGMFGLVGALIFKNGIK